MQFHQYMSLRNKAVHSGRLKASKASAREFRELTLANFRSTFDKLSSTQTAAGLMLQMEAEWNVIGRPYYNVWPVAIELSKTVKLEVPFSAVELPFRVLLLRFAVGHELSGVTTAMLSWSKDAKQGRNDVNVACDRKERWTQYHHCYQTDEPVEAWFETLPPDDLAAPMIRLVVFIGLLANDSDFITPVVLSKDRQKHEATDDPNVKKWLEDRAVRRAGRGFDVGKKLQLEKEKSPHWRNPHLALFWTGEGRTKPIIKMRSGAVVQRVSMADVPTGYLGPETDEEDKIDEEKTPRESIPKSRRFEILKRDGYKCQLCGRLQDDGVKLHVDHRIPLAKGGSNEDDNLWTLCEDCNLGKSDRDL